MSDGFEEAIESLPTMSQFAKVEDCAEGRLRHMFNAGRAEGMRAAAGIAVKLVEKKSYSSVGRTVSNAILAAIPTQQEEASDNQT